MRHRKAGRKLNRNSSHRKALFKNLSIALIEQDIIRTTLPKAKELRRFIEPLITLAKKGDLHSRRQVLKKIKHKEIVQALFNEIAPMYANRPGGYSRITKLGFRDNDRASVSLIEFIDYVECTDSKWTSTEKKKEGSQTQKTLKLVNSKGIEMII
jgi:large subunit ribosomal protein L17